MQHTITDQYTRQYLRDVKSEWGKISFGTETEQIPIADVYIMLQAVENRRAKHSDLTDMAERVEHAGLPQPLEHPLPLPDRAQNTNKFQPSDPPPTPLPLSEIIHKTRNLVLLGEPGAGKSTMLQFIGLGFVQDEEGWARNKLEINRPGIPVLVKLGESVDDPEIPLENVLAHGVNTYLGLPTETQAREVIDKWLKQGQLIALLDGLDEIPGKKRQQVATAIRKFAMRWENCRVILTSRTAGYVPVSDSDLFLEYRIKPLQSSEEERPFIQGWMKARAKAVFLNWDEQRATINADQLLETLNSQPALRRLTDNPLLLRLAVTVYHPDKLFVNNRANLYREYVETVVWDQRDIIEDLKDKALADLETLAWQLQTGQDPNRLKDDTLLRQKLGLLADHEGKLIFSHKTFQEYFIARRLAKAWAEKESRQRTWAVLHARLHNPDWREPLLLLAGMLKKADATDFVQHAWSQSQRIQAT